MRGSVILLVLSLTAGCSSSYEPARSPRVEIVFDGGQPTFVKDGVHFGSAAFGTGLVDAVQSNPRAEHHARIGRNLMVGGFALDLVGLGSEIGALAVLAHDRNEHPGAPASGLAVGLLVGGIAAGVTGTVMILTGQPHVYDAINIYNDGVDARALPAPTPTETQAPTAALLGPRVQHSSRVFR